MIESRDNATPWSRENFGAGLILGQVKIQDPMSQMTQFLKYLFQWFIGQGRKPVAEGKEYQSSVIGKLEV